MKNLYSVYILILLFLLPAVQAVSQTIIHGKIQDEATKETLVGATIHIKGTNKATVTDINGDFSLSVEDSLPVTLVYGYIGYLEKEVEVYDAEIPLEITLKPKLTGDEVVIIGYGQEERKNLISSIATVNPEETKQIPVASFDAQLQGKASGVQINSTSGMPGEGVRIRVRGTTSINASNDPLYIIDGVFINGNSLHQLSGPAGPSANGVAGGVNLGEKTTSPLADISPSDIENIEVLKDASATAIYGSRAANGVVIVTTKRGSFDSEKTKISFNTSTGFAAVQQSRLWKIASGPEHAQIVNEQWINSGKDKPSLNQNAGNVPFQRAPDGSFNPGAKIYRGNPEDQGTYSQDRLNQVFRTARLQNYDLSIQGGNKTSRYYIGVPTQHRKPYSGLQTLADIH